MGIIGPDQDIELPRPQPLATGLLNAAPPTPTATNRWENGMVFVPLSCEEGGIWLPCGSGDAETKSSGEAPMDAIEVVPGIAELEYTCSTFGYESIDYPGRARDQLELVKGKRLERYFWRADEVADAGLTTPALARADWSPNFVDLTSSSGSTPLAYALAALQQHIADCLGARGMIHCTVRTASLWFGDLLIFLSGGQLMDPFGNIIVPGAGYDGSDPYTQEVDETGDTAWAYATGMTSTYVGPTEVYPTEVGQALDRLNNQVSYRAEATVAAAWSMCCHAGVNVNLCNTCCEEGS